MMHKSRVCNGCGAFIPYDHGYYFDEKYNMFCLECDACVVVVSTQEVTEHQKSNEVAENE